MLKRPLSVVQWAAICAAMYGCHQPAAAPGVRYTLRLAGDATTSPIVQAASKLSDVSIEHTALSGASVASLLQLRRGEIDIGVALADVAYLASTGQLGEWGAFDQLRGMATLDVNTFHFLVGKNVPVTSIRELKGLRVAVGAPGTSTALIGEALLKAQKVEDVHAQEVPYPVAIAGLKEGRFDAAFMIQLLGSDLVTQATQSGARVVDVDGPAIDALRQQRPFVRRTLIPKGTYSGQHRSIRTLGVDRVLICRADLDDDLVYRILEAFFAMASETSPPTTLDRAPATPLRLHPGAARYYRQRELSP